MGREEGVRRVKIAFWVEGRGIGEGCVEGRQMCSGGWVGCPSGNKGCVRGSEGV